MVERAGGGAPVEFSGVVDAMRCAIEVQSGMVEHNAGSLGELRMELRRRRWDVGPTAPARDSRANLATRCINSFSWYCDAVAYVDARRAQIH